MPDYTLSELKEFLATLDMLVRIGELTDEADLPMTATIQPGLDAMVRFKGLTVPRGKPGPFDPVHSVVPSHIAAKMHDTPAAEAAPQPAPMRAADPIPPAPQVCPEQLPAVPVTEPEAPADARRKNFDGEAWTEREERDLIEVMAIARASGEYGAQRRALRAYAELTGRTLRAVEVRAERNLKDRIHARVAELDAARNQMLGGEPGGLQQHSPAENAPVQGVAMDAATPEAQPDEQDAAPVAVTTGPEQDGAEVSVSGATAPADEAPAAHPESDDDAQVVQLEAQQARAEVPVSVAPARATDVAPVARAVAKVPAGITVKQYEAWVHLCSVPRNKDWTLERDAELMRLADSGWTVQLIAEDLGLSAKVIEGRFDILTNRRTIQRSVAAQMLAHMLADRQTTAV